MFSNYLNRTGLQVDIRVTQKKTYIRSLLVDFLNNSKLFNGKFVDKMKRKQINFRGIGIKERKKQRKKEITKERENERKKAKIYPNQIWFQSQPIILYFPIQQKTLDMYMFPIIGLLFRGKEVKLFSYTSLELPIRYINLL